MYNEAWICNIKLQQKYLKKVEFILCLPEINDTSEPIIS